MTVGLDGVPTAHLQAVDTDHCRHRKTSIHINSPGGQTASRYLILNFDPREPGRGDPWEPTCILPAYSSAQPTKNRGLITPVALCRVS